MAANKVAGGTRRLVFTILTFAASIFCILAILAVVFAFFTPSGMGMRGVIMAVLAIGLAVLAVKFDGERKKTGRSPEAGQNR